MTLPLKKELSIKRPNHYIDNQEFLAALIAFKASVEEAKAKGESIPPVSNYIGLCFMKIAQHLSYAKNFINYSWREEMISDAIENCLKCVANFDPQKSTNPFAYFTQVSWFAFIRRIQKEQKEQKIKGEILRNADLDAIIAQTQDSGEFNDQFLDYIKKQIEFLDSK